MIFITVCRIVIITREVGGSFLMLHGEGKVEFDLIVTCITIRHTGTTTITVTIVPITPTTTTVPYLDREVFPYTTTV
jgi:hypothetical protein